MHDGRRVSVHNADVFKLCAEFVRDHLRERRFQALAVRRDSERRRDGAGRVDADGRRLGAGIDRHAGRDRDARSDAGQFGVAREADAETPALFARRKLLLAEFAITDRFVGNGHRLCKRRAVPYDSRTGLERKVFGPDEVLQTQVDRIAAHLVRRHVNQTLGDEGRDRPSDPR
jgi:hypothetical protein